MKPKKDLQKLLTFILLSLYGVVNAQLSCDDKGYFYAYYYDDHNKKVYITNIVDGDVYWCSSEKKRFADDQKIEIIRKAVKAADADAVLPNFFWVVPDNQGRHGQSTKAMGNDYESVKKSYDEDIKISDPKIKVYKITLKDEDFK